jgi:hypothetical protein
MKILYGIKREAMNEGRESYHLPKTLLFPSFGKLQ